jgi:thioredoxin reductase (NADPH)
MRQLTVLSRQWCHLCHDMVAELQPLVAGYPLEIVVVDVDEHPELEPVWGEWVPVLLADGVELCHYHLDPVAVRAYLAKIG